MRQKLSQFHKNIRKQMKEEYFRQRRTELLLYREKQQLQIIERHREKSSSMDRYGWRGIVLERDNPIQEEFQLEKWDHDNAEIDFEINIQSLEDGEYYLNTILQQVNIRCFEVSIYLLGKLTSKILRPVRRLSFLEQKNQTNLVYMILTHTHNLLQANINHEIMIKRSIKNRKYLHNLFAEDYKMLLKRQDPIIIGQLISISHFISNSYNIPPNYQLIKYLLLRVTTNQNLQSFSESIDLIRHKLENLLMKFIILYKVEERSNLKELNIPHQQIIYDFNAYIQFNLINLTDFIKNNEHPFDYQFINNNLSYILTLHILIIKKFRTLSLNDLRQFNQNDYLIRESVVNLLEKIIVLHQEKAGFSNDLDETAIVLEEIVTVIIWYLIDAIMQVSRRFGRKGYIQIDKQTLEAIEDRKISLISMILLIKVKLRQLSLAYD